MRRKTDKSYNMYKHVPINRTKQEVSAGYEGLLHMKFFTPLNLQLKVIFQTQPDRMKNLLPSRPRKIRFNTEPAFPEKHLTLSRLQSFDLRFGTENCKSPLPAHTANLLLEH